MDDAPLKEYLKISLLPMHTNMHGTIFGGVILSHIDQAGAVAALRLGCTRVVTVAMDRVVFKQPVLVGDLVSFHAEPIRRGRTSVTVRVLVEAERRGGHGTVPVTEAEVTYVHIDAGGRPIALPAPA